MKKQISAAIFLVLGAAVLTSAQNSIEQGILKTRDEIANIKNRSLEMERIKRESYKRPTEDSTVRFPEIKEDFEKMQKINSDVLQPLFAKSPSNYAALLKAAAEINHRASRLNSNLFSLESEKDKENNKLSESPNLKSLIAKLDQSINNFVHSSIFQNIQVVNPDDSVKARKDLEMVIKISHLIKENAAKTMKDTAKN